MDQSWPTQAYCKEDILFSPPLLLIFSLSPLSHRARSETKQHSTKFGDPDIEL